MATQVSGSVNINYPFKEASTALFTAVQPMFDALTRLSAKTAVGDATALSGGYGDVPETRVVADLWRCSRGEIDLAEVVRRHGYHGPLEGEISARVWREDDTPLRRMVEGYAGMPDSSDPRRREGVLRAEREKLERLADKAGVAERVRFLGEVSERDLPALYNLASIYVGASRRAERIGVEGFGISLVEASACGLPVVAGNSGGVPDAVRDGETGFLVPPEDPAAFADAICRLLADDELVRRVGAAGRRAVESYYNWDRVVRELRAIEAEVVAR